jgi:hypothetical protein
MLILTASLLTFAGPAAACSCAVLEPGLMLEGSAYAFIGTVTGREPQGQGEVGGQVVYRFEVDTVFQGEVAPEVGIVSAANSAACGIEAPVGTRLAVFAYLEEGQLSSNLCSVTDPQSMITALGEGYAPTDDGEGGVSAAPPGSAVDLDWGAVGLAGGGLVLVVGAWLLFRRS